MKRGDGARRWLAALLVALGAPGADSAADTPPKLTVEVYRGGFATVNSFIFSNGKSLVVLDVQRKALEAEALVARIKALNLPLTDILISHGHTDHFTGMAVFRRAFPDARIVVANAEIKRDIKAYAIYMDRGGATGAEPALDPALKPKGPDSPDGFDYENNIRVLVGNRLEMRGGGTLELTTDYRPAEADHMTTVYSPALNALFLADFGYNDVHFWMGDDISRADIANWRAELLGIKARYATRHPVVYPGHGDPSGMALFDQSVQYIDDFTRVTLAAPSRAAAMQEMIRLYPTYREADFFLKYSVIAHVAR
jgi:glyoxylase-like metal-dependent hydrolase (beta-lactamase superfamily II)